MVYTSTSDPACYQNTDVLKNKANLKEATLLEEFELAMFLIRSEEDWPTGNYNATHYKELHHHLFQDVYDWAGEFRTIRIGKGGNWFCYPEHIEDQINTLFADLVEQQWFQNLPKSEFVPKAAHFLAELNAIHPFREGNGRTQMAFMIMLSENAGFAFDETCLDPKQVMEAMIVSFNGDERPLNGFLAKAIRD